MGRTGKVLAGAAVLASAAAAVASETVTYTYDSRGRLTKVVRSGTVNAGVSTSYSYDKADNRTNRTTSGVGGALMAAPAEAADASTAEGEPSDPVAVEPAIEAPPEQPETSVEPETPGRGR